MPTEEALGRFQNEHKSLDRSKRALFRSARKEFIQAPLLWERSGMQGSPVFPKHLGVKPVQGQRGIWEFAWAGDGRCTWEYGDFQHPRKCHIIWRRIGSHDIYGDP